MILIPVPCLMTVFSIVHQQRRQIYFDGLWSITHKSYKLSRKEIYLKNDADLVISTPEYSTNG